eukprot:CAMPEP_0196203710 /NCGR_PEP_ID=MMETSP0912-20130531/6094_1 /TAXON_ID=49265 /ORGANISM="Thalassiosira rotula, Strain GSO102" /LENGTH=160 /DNA_ID=CAMNT_0041477871 /DNA_START=275 /DNA_END=754 /DNA_ORIENTATION=-
MSRRRIHPRHIRHARARRRPLRILLHVVDHAPEERHGARRIQIRHGPRGRRAPRRGAHQPLVPVHVRVRPAVAIAVVHHPPRVVEPVAVLQSDVGAVVMEGEGGGRRAPEGYALYHDVLGVRSEGEVGAGEVDGAHVAFDGDVLGVDEDGGEFRLWGFGE